MSLSAPTPATPPTPPSVITVFGERAGLAEAYVAMLADTGISHGLIGPREAPRLWDRHVLNCAVVAPLFASSTVVADIGSGAGLPGLVLAMVRPDLDVHLIEPLHRRIVWLERAVTDLGLTNVTVHEARAEALGGVVDADYVTARAVARLSKLGRWAMALLPRGGQLIALKGERAQQELSEDLPALQRAGKGRVGEVTLSAHGADIVDPATLVVTVTIGAAAHRAGTASGPARRRATHKGSSGPASHGDAPKQSQV